MILVDAHVHIYDCFDLQTFLDSAVANFSAQAVQLANGDDFTGVLLLAETSGQNWFERLAEYIEDGPDVDSNRFDGWTFCRTAEECSLWAQNKMGHGMYLIAGHQIVTSERLEVLALATNSRFGDGAPLRRIIRDIRKKGGLAVIPWGLGKWMGRRKEIIENALEDINGTEVFLGDNGGRPLFLPRPRLFGLAQANGIKVLPGSDPLPFQNESRRVGSFGFSLKGSVRQNIPAEDLKQKLREPATHIQPYGNAQHLLPFLRNQCKIQVTKKYQK
jgi:hypothetical protein